MEIPHTYSANQNLNKSHETNLKKDKDLVALLPFPEASIMKNKNKTKHIACRGTRTKYNEVQFKILEIAYVYQKISEASSKC